MRAGPASGGSAGRERRGSAEAARLAVATSNPGKLREICRLLADLPVALEAMPREMARSLPEERGDYARCAAAKARAVAAQLGLPTLADDSGLEVDALGGAPGARSARYGGPGLDDAARVAKLLRALAGVPAPRRGARFACAAALAHPDGSLWTAFGDCRGRILGAPRGSGGFGYDPVFGVGPERSMAELPADVKNRISHRAQALRALRPALVLQLSRSCS